MVVKVFFGVLAAGLSMKSAHAYVDPGAGSVLIQLLLGGVAGIAIIFKLYWQRMKDFFTKFTKGGKPRP